MNEQEVRRGLAKAAKDRREADQRKAEATADAVRFLKRVADTEGISMTEAAKILGVTRVMAYKMLRG